jgi:hypothetical protein
LCPVLPSCLAELLWGQKEGAWTLLTAIIMRSEPDLQVGMPAGTERLGEPHHTVYIMHHSMTTCDVPNPKWVSCLMQVLPAFVVIWLPNLRSPCLRRCIMLSTE